MEEKIRIIDELEQKIGGRFALTTSASFRWAVARLGWWPADGIEVALMGKNLLEEEHGNIAELTRWIRIFTIRYAVIIIVRIRIVAHAVAVGIGGLQRIGWKCVANIAGRITVRVLLIRV